MNDVIRTSLYIDDGLYKEVKLYCLKNNITIKKFITDAIKEKLKEK